MLAVFTAMLAACAACAADVRAFNVYLNDPAASRTLPLAGAATLDVSVVPAAENLGGAFGGTSYTMASGITQHFVTGLAPGANHAANVGPNGGTSNIPIIAGGPFIADGAGGIGFTVP